MINKKSAPKTFGSTKLLVKRMLGPNNFESNKCFLWIKLFGHKVWPQTYFWSKHLFGPNKVLVQHFFESRHIFDLKECKDQTKFGSKKCWVPQNFWSKNMFDPKDFKSNKNWDSKIFMSKKVNNLWSPCILSLWITLYPGPMDHPVSYDFGSPCLL